MSESSSTPRSDRADEPVLEVEDLHVRFGRPGARFAGQQIHAVNGVGFEVAAGETLALVGESGSGKSTTARAALQLVNPSQGTVRLLGQDLSTVGRRELRKLRHGAQMVFQDPYSSLDPSMTVENIVGEPLRVHTKMNRQERRARVIEVLELAGVSESYLQRFPGEFSGGQRQRIAIARALATNPSLIVADEAVSALDVSIRNQILNLFRSLQGRLNLSYLFITHDLGVVQHLAHRVAVMYLGQIVEIGRTADVFANPAHPYTAALLRAMPSMTERSDGQSKQLEGEPPDPSNLPQGCLFAARCPLAQDDCRTVRPTGHITPSGQEVACHHPLQIGSRPPSDLAAR